MSNTALPIDIGIAESDRTAIAAGHSDAPRVGRQHTASTAVGRNHRIFVPVTAAGAQRHEALFGSLIGESAVSPGVSDLANG